MGSRRESPPSSSSTAAAAAGGGGGGGGEGGSARVAAGPLSEGSPAPALFDGTTRLYFSAMCPYAQRVSIAANFKELVDVERVEINLGSKPEWYKEKVYPPGKVPALEHKGAVKGESLELLDYLDQNFDGPRLLLDDEATRAEAEPLIALTSDLVKSGYGVLSDKQATSDGINAQFGPLLNQINELLGRHSLEGPFFLGSFSSVDIAYAPFMERFLIAFKEFKHYDVTAGRPNLQAWYQALEGVKAYTDTKVAPERIIETYKRMLASNYFQRAGVTAPPATSGNTPSA